MLLPGIVDEADLTEGNAKLLGSQAIAQIGGPGLGGLLAQATGPVGGRSTVFASPGEIPTCAR